MKFEKKSVSKIALTDLLRRKRTNLSKYLTDNGIFSYELLVTRCFSIGVIPPSEDQFLKARDGEKKNFYEVSSPTEGIVVLNPVLDEIFEKNDNISDTEEASALVEKVEDLEKPRRKKRAAL